MAGVNVHEFKVNMIGGDAVFNVNVQSLVRQRT